MQSQGIQPDRVTFISVLSACAKTAQIQQGKLIYACILNCRYVSDLFVANTLVGMYSKCGSINDAWKVFTSMATWDVVSWNAIISGCVMNRDDKGGLYLFDKMQKQGLSPNGVTFVSVLIACSQIAYFDKGKTIHASILQLGLETDVLVINAIIDMYSACGQMLRAREVFDRMPMSNIDSWNIMLAGYGNDEDGLEAVRLFMQMLYEGIKPTKVTFIRILNSCTSVFTLAHGKFIHSSSWKSHELDMFIGSALIDMYLKCKSMNSAEEVFDTICKRNTAVWNAMLAGYAQNGAGQNLQMLFTAMCQESVEPDVTTFVALLNACAGKTETPSLGPGKLIHSRFLRGLYPLDVFVGSALLEMYGRCGHVSDAHQVFHKMPTQNVVSWSAMIAVYAEHNRTKEAIDLFGKMELEGMRPNMVTFVTTLGACANEGVLFQGKRIHSSIIDDQYETDTFVGSTLIDMYAKCGCIKDAYEVFDRMPIRTLVTWNAAIGGHGEHGNAKEAVLLLAQMQDEGVQPNENSFVNVLSACSSGAALEQGKRVHASILKYQHNAHVFVASAVVDLYISCNWIANAWQVFERIDKRNVVAWNAVITGYKEPGDGMRFLDLLKGMQEEGLKPNKITFLSILNACVALAALECGRRIHSYIVGFGYEMDVIVQNSLIDMYLKCGSIEDAEMVFGRMTTRNVVSWNTIIGGHAQYGNGIRALRLLQQMQQDGMKPNDVTYISVLSGCLHASLMVEGFHYFSFISENTGASPTCHHYACIVNLLGRVGYLEEAEEVTFVISSAPIPVVWMALLGACGIYGNLEVAERAAEYVLQLEPGNVAVLVQLSNMYALSENLKMCSNTT